jgi:hypothetical protein
MSDINDMSDLSDLPPALIGELRPTKITAPKIKAAMRKLYAQPEWAIFFEVRNATGFDANRSADAVAMALWPSRGLEVHGFEIKISRSDWRREAANPEKAETIAAYCDCWWVVAPPGVVPEAELPPAWGLREFDGRNWKTIRKAEKTTAAALDRPFVAALLRQASKADEAEIKAAVEVLDEKRREAHEKRVQQEIKYVSDDLLRLRESVAEFEAASGLKITEYGGAHLGRQVALVQAMGVGVHASAERLAALHEDAAKRLREVLGDSEPGPTDPGTPAVRPDRLSSEQSK